VKKILWITGQPDSGKSTLARELKKYLPVIIIDDTMRKHFNLNWNDSEGLLLMARIARAINYEGFDVVVCAGAPYEKWRNKVNAYFREIIFNDRIIPEVEWVYLLNDRAKNVVRDYEVPSNAIIINNNIIRVEEGAKIILRKVWGVDV